MVCAHWHRKDCVAHAARYGYGDRERCLSNNFASLKTLAASGVHTVGDFAFFRCRALKTVSLPSAATIEFSAFNYCTVLASLTLGTTLPTLEEAIGVFRDAGRDTEAGFTIYVPTTQAKAALEAEIANTGSDWHKALKVPDNIGDGKFKGVAVKR